MVAFLFSASISHLFRPSYWFKFFLFSELRLGFYLLAILPTTVSSAVLFTALSGGHTSNAIFATIFSNLLSIVLVPTVALAYLAAGTDASVPLAPLLTKLLILVALPLIAGQVIRKFLSDISEAVSKYAKIAFEVWTPENAVKITPEEIVVGKIASK